MSIQLPEVDGRTYQELLSEATARIPVHNPEWVNFNDSDPGMTLLQLWAFMSENLLYQSRLIPERNRLKFLSLLGVDLEPAAAAHGIVEFSFLKGRLEMTTIASDQQALAGQVPFRTTNALTAAPIEVLPVIKKTIAAEDGFDEDYALLYGSFLEAGTNFDYYETTPVMWSATGAGAVDLAETVDGSLWMAVLARSANEVTATREVLGGQIITLGFVPSVEANAKQLLPKGLDAADAEPVLEFHVPDIGQPLPETAADRVPTYRRLESWAEGNVLLRPGVVQVQLPDETQLGVWLDLDPIEAGVGRFPPALEGDEADRLVTWIRVRPAAGADDDAGQRDMKLLWAGINAALVQQRTRTTRELVGTGTGEPDQIYRLANTPVLIDTVELSVDGTAWTLVDDLMDAGPELAIRGGAEPRETLPTTVARVERSTGEVRFGDGMHGARPPRNARIVASYDSGGGRDGLVGIGSISKAAGLPAGSKVSNPVPTWGADDAKSVDQAEREVASFVRHRERMVVAEDFRDIARQTPGVDIGRVEVLPLVHPELPGQQLPGVVTLLLLPSFDSRQPEAPQPDQYFLRTVCEYVDSRRLLTTELHLRGPNYVPLWLSVGIDVMAGRSIGLVREAVKDAIREFLSPLTGGHLAHGWPLLTPVNRLEILAVAARVDGVAQVFDVELAGAGGTLVEQMPMATSLHLPHLVGLEVRQGDPLPISALQGESIAIAPTTLPIPVIPEECC